MPKNILMYGSMLMICASIGGMFFPLMFPTLVPSRTYVLYWRGALAGAGDTFSYYVFTRSIKSRSLFERHELDHLFGRALQESGASSPFHVCDGNISSNNGLGCWHEFIAAAMEEAGGHAAARALLHECHRMGGDILSCEHSIGHAFMKTLGYDVESIDNSLALCGSLDEPRGCRGGVFMEYFLRNTSDAGMNNSLTLDANSAFSVCASVPEEALPACIYWRSKWWWHELRKQLGPEEASRPTFALCRTNRESSKEMGSCIAAIGHSLAGSFDNAIDAISRECDNLTKVEHERYYCRFYAGRRLLRAGRTEGLSLCSVFPNREANECEQGLRDTMSTNRDARYLDIE